jgi:hypothetical protein
MRFLTSGVRREVWFFFIQFVIWKERYKASEVCLNHSRTKFSTGIRMNLYDTDRMVVFSEQCQFDRQRLLSCFLTIGSVANLQWEFCLQNC